MAKYKLKIEKKALNKTYATTELSTILSIKLEIPRWYHFQISISQHMICKLKTEKDIYPGY